MSPTLIPSHLKTPQALKKWFEDEGVVVTEWARAHGFRPEVIYALLNARTVGRRGEAHRAAIELGLKPRSRAAPHLPCAEETGSATEESVMP